MGAHVTKNQLTSNCFEVSASQVSTVAKTKGGGYFISGVSTSCSSSDTFYKVAATFTESVDVNLGWNATNKRFDYTGSGETVAVNLTWTATTNTMNNVLTYAVYKNGSAVSHLKRDRSFGVIASPGSLSLCGYLTLVENDYIELYVASENSNATATTSQCNLMLYAI